RSVELARVDRLLHPAEVDLVETELERRVLEAALRQTPMQRHLAAFEALDPHAGARRLTLAAPSAGLTDARADTASDPHALLARAGIVGEFVQLHSPLLLSFDDPDEVPNLGNHPAGLWCIRQFGHAADPVETKPDQRLPLRMLAANRAAGLFNLDHFFAFS